MCQPEPRQIPAAVCFASNVVVRGLHSSLLPSILQIVQRLPPSEMQIYDHLQKVWTCLASELFERQVKIVTVWAT